VFIAYKKWSPEGTALEIAYYKAKTVDRRVLGRV
jgi:hypothetical protein